MTHEVDEEFKEWIKDVLDDFETEIKESEPYINADRFIKIYNRLQDTLWTFGVFEKLKEYNK